MAKHIGFERLTEHAENLEDPRSTVNRKHPLMNIVTIAICASIAGAQTWTEVETFGKERKEWLERYLDLESGIPSHDTFGRLFRILRPEVLSEMLLGWIDMVFGQLDTQVVAIDGKTARRTGDSSSGKNALHMVSAWATEDNLVLGQIRTADKSNEITAIPLLLESIDIEGRIVTIDAMGCQKAIAETITANGGDYVFGLKGNQSSLRDYAEDLFAEVEDGGGEFADVKVARHTTNDKGHGRIEKREYTVMEDLCLPSRKKEWEGLRSFARVVSTRTEKGKTSMETRYYATSLPCKVKKVAYAIRQHWTVENSLHWCLDIAFREDECRIRKDHGPENMAILARVTHSLLKNERTHKQGIKSKRLRAALSPDYMEKVLCAPRS